MNKPIKKRPAIFIVNLQWTPKDDVAALKINGKCDNVMKLVMEYLSLETPFYNRMNDPIFAHASQLNPKEIHTTTQPILIKCRKNDKSLDALKNSCKDDLETEDSDDDCPLNILKMKMNPKDIEKPLDLSIKVNNVDVKDEIVKSNADCDLQLTESNNKSETDVPLSDDSEKAMTLFSKPFFNRTDENGYSVPLAENIDINTMTRVGLNNYVNNSQYLEPLSIEDNIENLERVHIEMQTCDAEVCKVCILLVKSKTHNNSFNNLPNIDSNVNGLSSLSDLKKSSNIGILGFRNASKDLKLANAENNNIEARLLSKISLPNIFNANENKKHHNKEQFDISSLRNFRKLKNFKSVFSEIGVARDEKHRLGISKCTSPKPNAENGSQVSESKEPLNLCWSPKFPLLFMKKEHKICNSHTSDKLFLNPKPPPINNDIDINNLVLDLRSAQKRIEYENNLNLHSSENAPVAKFKQCEYFAKIVIQKTILFNRKELQYAYSGLHSIINPIPFCSEYEFSNVFNSLNFIKFVQKLRLKQKRLNMIRSRSTNFKRERMRKRKFGFNKRTRTRRKDPTCEFCYEHYKSYVCNFYTPLNSEQRFEKWHKGKLIMCDCCIDSDTSNSDVESSDVSSDSTSCGELKENNVSKSDLKNSVQINVNNDEVQSENVQAGWFGKGFRKNRRRKR